MRAFVLLALAVVLAVPAVAIADRGSDGQRTADEASRSVKQMRAKAKNRKDKRNSARLVRATDDEREIKGRIVSLAPLRVGSLTCVVPPTASVASFRVGDFVEVTCDLVRGQWVLRRLKLEDDDEFDDDERELTARIVSLSPFTVDSLTCLAPARISLAGFRVGDLVEITCDRIRGEWVLRKVHHEDRDDDDRIGRNDNSGPGNGDDDDDDDNSGSGGSGRG